MSHFILFPTLSKRTSFPPRRAFFKGIVVFLSIILLSLICQVPTRAQNAQRPVPKTLNGHENHKISLHDAAALTRNFRNSTGNDEGTIIGEFFGKDALIAALNQDNCIGLRIYYGKQNDGTPALVFVGVDQSGIDMTNGFVGDMGYLCPPVCGGGANPLTQDNITSSGLSELRPSGMRPK